MDSAIRLLRELVAVNSVNPTLVRGALIADLIASIGSMDFVLGDTDR